MKSWEEWQKSYQYGLIVIRPPDEIRDLVNKQREEYDPLSQSLLPGGTYPLELRTKIAANGKLSIIDANNFITWFNTEPCDRYIFEYWPDESDPDKFLTSDLTRIELNNPCLP